MVRGGHRDRTISDKEQWEMTVVLVALMVAGAIGFLWAVLT